MIGHQPNLKVHTNCHDRYRQNRLKASRIQEINAIMAPAAAGAPELTANICQALTYRAVPATVQCR